MGAPSEPATQAPSEQAEAPSQADRHETLTPPFQPAKVESIQAAIDKVTAIIGDLRDVLNDMELVLEYLEDAERQQIADEREIEMLQQRLNSMHRRIDRPPQGRPPPPRSEDTGEPAD